MYDNFASFDRGLLKDRAKHIIKEDYWKCFLAGIVLQIAVYGSALVTASKGVDAYSGFYINHLFYNHPFFLAIFLLPIVICFMLLGSAVSIALSKLIEAPLEVSGRRFFLEASQRRYDLGNLGFGFTQNFLNVFKVILIREVYVILWTFLFIVPGIIKGYSYSMVGQILAENPNMDYKRALEISDNMTKGYKMDLFLLDLSFIGWLFLGSLLFGIGTFFVYPYVSATKTEAYLYLRARALNLGLVRLGELSR